MQTPLSTTALSLSLFVASQSLAQTMTPGAGDETDTISEITVRATRVANTRPAVGFATLVTALRFDPLAEVQSRGIAEGQSDVTVRGGIFENTGFKLGAVTVMDPQTGHYAAGLGIDPMLTTGPVILQGVDNAVEGFNSTVGTVAYGIRPLEDSGSLSFGAGSDAMNFQALQVARTASGPVHGTLGASFAFARSKGDGSLPGGDHRFSRYNLLLQRANDVSQSDLLLSYQDKFYGWPGAYTGFSTLAETDDTQTSLIFANHRRETDAGWWELGGYYRRLVDDYDFDRTTSESGTPGSFEHETRSFAAGLRGRHTAGAVNWYYGAQLTADELVRSTDLTNGNFDDRTYAKIAIVPSYDVDLDDSSVLTVRAGASVDYSNRDGNQVSPVLAAVYARPATNGQTEIAVQYAGTSQLPGYTALKSNPTGLFGGNPDLGRERAKQWSVSAARVTERWQARASIFARRDDDLVDWTYATDVPFSRRANAVHIDVFGFEVFVARQWSNVDLVAGYTYLDKDEDYGSALVDASFYALNFARHRATLALTYRFAETTELRIDNEYRRQQKNPLRIGDDSTYLASLALVWEPKRFDGLAASLIADNLTDSEYQPFPGTPAAARQLSLIVTYGW